MTSYDEIWEFFLLNCKTSDINLPTEESLIYKSIRNAVLRFNNRLRDKKLKCNDETETVDRVMNEDELLILVHYLRLIFLINEQTFSDYMAAICKRRWCYQLWYTNQFINKVN